MAIRDFPSIRTLSPSSNALSSIEAGHSRMNLYITIVVFSLLFELIRKMIFKKSYFAQTFPSATENERKCCESQHLIYKNNVSIELCFDCNSCIARVKVRKRLLCFLSWEYIYQQAVSACDTQCQEFP